MYNAEAIINKLNYLINEILIGFKCSKPLPAKELTLIWQKTVQKYNYDML